MSLITVLIPTHKRPVLLRRAIASVLAQKLHDWDLVVSDDEDPPGETWSYLQQLAASDPRIAVTRNPGPHGQCGNVSHAMRQARGEWIKFLYDDDLLRPDCLSVLAAAVEGQDRVVLASCTMAEYRRGTLIRSGEQGGPLLLRVSQRHLHLAMYLQEASGGGAPSQVMVRRTIVDRGVLFESHPELRSGVDSYFFIQVARLGDALIVRIPLVEFHQGEHESVTSSMEEQELDAEFRALRRIQFPFIDPALKPPSLETVYQMLQLIRAVKRTSQRKFGAAAILVLKSWRPGAWWLAGRWLLRRRFPDRFSRIPKVVLDDSRIREIIQRRPE